MRTLAFALSLGLVGAPLALAEGPPPSSKAEGDKPPAAHGDGKAPASGAGQGQTKGQHPQKKGDKKEESLDELVGSTPGDEQPAATPQQPSPTGAPSDPATAKGPAASQQAAAPAGPPATGTDDNDNSPAAPPPTALEPVRPTQAPRKPGPYELTKLDCRVLDGAGVERLLPKRVIAGEEPDLLCRVMVTQPATVAAAEHTLTLTVHVGGRGTYQQVRPVRMSAVGRRAVLFVIPSDKIASDQTATAVIRVALSGPATPSTREQRFNVESED